MSKVFIISPVRNADQATKKRLEVYRICLEAMGHTAHLPHLDTDQSAKGMDICRQNMEAIRNADEVHIFYDGSSQGVHFDMGVAFALNKKIVLVESNGTGFKDMLDEWSQNV